MNVSGPAAAWLTRWLPLGDYKLSRDGTDAQVEQAVQLLVEGGGDESDGAQTQHGQVVADLGTAVDGVGLRLHPGLDSLSPPSDVQSVFVATAFSLFGLPVSSTFRPDLLLQYLVDMAMGSVSAPPGSDAAKLAPHEIVLECLALVTGAKVFELSAQPREDGASVIALAQFTGSQIARGKTKPAVCQLPARTVVLVVRRQIWLSRHGNAYYCLVPLRYQSSQPTGNITLIRTLQLPLTLPAPDTGVQTCAICREDVNNDERRCSLNACCHVFHLDCISSWSQVATRCPTCRAEFSVLIFAGPGGRTRRKPVARKEQVYTGEELDAPCQICHQDTDDACLLLCDGFCGYNAHTYCLGLTGVPEGEWYCEACEVRRTEGAAVAAAVTTMIPAQAANLHEERVQRGLAAVRAAAAVAGGAATARPETPKRPDRPEPEDASPRSVRRRIESPGSHTIGSPAAGSATPARTTAIDAATPATSGPMTDVQRMQAAGQTFVNELRGAIVDDKAAVAAAKQSNRPVPRNLPSFRLLRWILCEIRADCDAVKRLGLLEAGFDVILFDALQTFPAAGVQVHFPQAVRYVILRILREVQGSRPSNDVDLAIVRRSVTETCDGSLNTADFAQFQRAAVAVVWKWTQQSQSALPSTGAPTSPTAAVSPTLETAVGMAVSKLQEMLEYSKGKQVPLSCVAHVAAIKRRLIRSDREEKRVWLRCGLLAALTDCLRPFTTESTMTWMPQFVQDIIDMLACLPIGIYDLHQCPQLLTMLAAISDILAGPTKTAVKSFISQWTTAKTPTLDKYVGVATAGMAAGMASEISAAGAPGSRKAPHPASRSMMLGQQSGPSVSRLRQAAALIR